MNNDIMLAYDRKFLIKFLLWLVIVSVAMKVTGGALTLVFPFVALCSLFAKKMVNLFIVVIAMVAYQITNTFFCPNSIITMLSIRCTLLILSLLMATQIAGHRVSPLVSPFSGIFLYIAWEVVSSYQGFAPMISYLKLLLFSMIYLALFQVANSVLMHAKSDSRKIRSVILAFALYFLVGSVLTIPFPAISLMTYSEINNTIYIESLFKGLASHSQSLGPMVALFSVVITADLVFSVKKIDKFYLAAMIAAPILILKSGSRTALGTYAISMAVIGYLALRARGLGNRWRGKVISTFMVTIILGATVILFIPKYRQSMLDFVVKKSGQSVAKSEVTIDAIVSSRQGAMDVSLENFHKKPLLGNGFQVSDSMQSHSAGNGLLSYLSAPIEKGVWVTAVLEEGGAVGLVLFGGFLLCTFFVLVKRRAYISACTLVSASLSNLGEFTFFSMTYTGGLVWAMIFAAVVMDGQRKAQERLMVM